MSYAYSATALLQQRAICRRMNATVRRSDKGNTAPTSRYQHAPAPRQL